MTSPEQLKALTTKRGQIRRKITQFITYLNKFELSGNADYFELDERLNKAEQTWELFDEVQSQIELIDDTQQPIMMGIEDEVSEEAKDNLLESMGVMEIFLKDKSWIAGDDLTIADLTVLALISTVEVVVFPIDPERFPRLADWFESAKQLPYFDECNKEALEQVAELAKHETPLI